MKSIFILFIICSFCLSSCEAKTPDNSGFDNILNKDDDKTPAIDLSKANGYKRFFCYNVKHFGGMDETIDYNRVASVIKPFDPDFIALQELDSATTRSNMENQIAILGDKLGMYSYFAGTIPYRGGKYGIGLLAKEPALKTYAYELPGTEKRKFIIAEYADFLIICTHLDLTESARIESAIIISDIVGKFNKKAYLAGDLNEVKLDGPMFTEFKKNWKIVSPIKNTFPTNPSPNRCIDFILSFNAGGNYDISKGDVLYQLSTVNVSSASDHFPLFIDFK